MTLARADALRIPLRDESVDEIITSPPYFGQRSYLDGGEHYDGQIGSEPTPQDFVEVMLVFLDECHRVLKPTGSCWINLGDKYGGSGAPGTTGTIGYQARNRTGMKSYNQATDVLHKSLMGLPWRFFLGAICPDRYRAPRLVECWHDDERCFACRPAPHPQWIGRAELVWNKPNGLPESTIDRVRRSHEMWLHLTKQGQYFAGIDELREPHARPDPKPRPIGSGNKTPYHDQATDNVGWKDRPVMQNPLGKLPGSVWTIATEGLEAPEYMVLAHAGDMAPGFMSGDDNAWRWARHHDVLSSPWPRPDGNEPGPFLVAAPDHFAAYPQEWPRRLILGWSPSAFCTKCDEPRRPIVEVDQELLRTSATTGRPKQQDLTGSHGGGHNDVGYPYTRSSATITGYECACDVPLAPTRPAVILDPFGGTGTTAMVARALGRYPVSLDLSADYLRLARWRIYDSGHASKSEARTNRERQGSLL